MKHGPVNLPVLQALFREVQLDLLPSDTLSANTQYRSEADAYPFWSEEDGALMWMYLEGHEFDVLRDSSTRYEMWCGSLEYRALLCGEIGAA